VRRPATAHSSDKGAVSPTAWTKTLWVNDLRTNVRLTLKTTPLKRSDLDEFVALYRPEDRHARPRQSRRGGDCRGRWDQCSVSWP